MILRRRPHRDDNDFRDDAPRQIAEKHLSLTGIYRRDGVVRFHFPAYAGREDGSGHNYADFAAELDWHDVVLAIAQLAQSGEPRAVAILPLLRDPERVRAALDMLAEATRAEQ